MKLKGTTTATNAVIAEEVDPYFRGLNPAFAATCFVRLRAVDLPALHQLAASWASLAAPHLCHSKIALEISDPPFVAEYPASVACQPARGKSFAPFTNSA